MSQDNEILVKVEGVSKKFCRDLKKSLWYGMCDVASELLPIQNSKFKIQNSEDALRPGEFWANKDISFELRRGECLGLIGRNGAGKTTLLKMLNGLIKPDEGSIEMRGRVGALIALGAGFNPILTGRENVYVNGSILGLTKEEIDARIEEIIEFAEIRDFIDSPVQSYSSGMQVRLGFAVATALDPDILILDEVLAVGDAAFRAKCYNRISQIQKSAAVIFVSHNMQQVARICDCIVTMEKGKSTFFKDIEKGVEHYDKLNSSGPGGEKHLTISSPLTQFDVRSCSSLYTNGQPFSLEINWAASGDLEHFLVRVMILNSLGEAAADITYDSRQFQQVIQNDKGRWTLGIPSLPLKNGSYEVGVTLVGPGGSIVAWSLRQTGFEVRGACPLAIANCHIPAGFWETQFIK